MPEVIVSRNIVSRRLEQALDALKYQHWSPIYGRLRYILANKEADAIKELVEAWDESQRKVEGEDAS